MCFCDLLRVNKKYERFGETSLQPQTHPTQALGDCIPVGCYSACAGAGTEERNGLRASANPLVGWQGLNQQVLVAPRGLQVSLTEQLAFAIQ